MVASRAIQSGAYDYMSKHTISSGSVRRVIENAMSRFRVRMETSAAMEKMAGMSTRDELTGLFNKRYFDDCLTGEVERSRRYQSQFTVFLADLNYFKQLDKTAVHPSYDKIMQQTAQILRRSLRKSDIPCRIGSEEYAVILPNTKDEECRLISERFKASLEESQITWKDRKITITLNMDVMSFDGNHISSTKETLKQVDKLLFKADISD